ncbi:Planctomycete cytochrome C [Gimesia panareensis]|uniref:Planctomycete cytochrome C n=1 Tax=Gimesia panareensis TaxID=2527978 RepID=A0A517Q3Y7_9PLAN|nr:PSD1 and planctomycete cytochrome C domain-containing protein [Gimesia panareensis]QDT26337.1 Planctomycete cytochrome C [Gimesia panareensis]
MPPQPLIRHSRPTFYRSDISLGLMFLLVALIPGQSPAAEPAAPVFYEDNVKAILEAKCTRCHNSEKKQAGLDLSSPRSMLKGSESGRILQAGDADASLLFQMIDADEMPPEEKDRLTPTERESLRSWIQAGTHFRKAVKTAPAVTQHDIIPLLHLRCVACHGGRRQEAGLDLRTKQSILKGGKSGPAVVPGDPESSLLIRRIKSAEMPPRRKLVSVSVKPMEANELERLSQWIELGLPEVSESELQEPETLVTEQDRQFWSFQPPAQVQPPQVQHQDRVRNPIDAFILSKLESQGLTFAPTADKRTLMRRLSIDLTGLPPTPQEIDSFLNNHDPKAYEQLVERLLASPRYGERWARHWLDVVGYADSEGAQNEDKLRPHMYRYRDYVIRSLNQDKPYSRFLLEQIAGDELVDYRSGNITPEVYDCLVATGFLRTAPDRTFANITNFVPDRLEVISDEIQILGSAVMGLTIKCARCHSHKFDPIPQSDYYRLTAVFKAAYDEHDWLKSQGPRTLPYVSQQEHKKHQEHERQLSIQQGQLKQRLDQLKPTAPDYQQKSAEIKKQIDALKTQHWPAPRIRALWSRESPSPSYIYKRGNYLTPGRPVPPGVPAVLTSSDETLDFDQKAKNGKPVGRRLVFARWLTQPDHPLTARVMVNRIWLHHFGRGIVNTPGNFGRAGERPTHPELLDWLAREFVRQNWSIKSLHRLMVTSSTYRQSSEISDDAARLDPSGSLLSRMPLNRMEAEVLRDSLLYICGQLDETPFGPADSVESRADGLVTSQRGDKGWRRSIYVLQRRTKIPTLLENFDFPQMGPNCLQRGESLVAPQALHLLNNLMIHQLAEHFASRIRKESGDQPADQINQIYLRALGRPPSSEETEIGLMTLQQLEEKWKSESKDEKKPSDSSQKALTSYCHAIFNLAEFQYID